MTPLKPAFEPRCPDCGQLLDNLRTRWTDGVTVGDCPTHDTVETGEEG